MEVENVMKNIHYFYEVIIPKAFYSSDWNEENIKLAYQWAKACEEIYLKGSGERLEILDSLLQSISNKLNEFYKTSLCFHDLQNSNALLTQAFHENPYIENDRIISQFQDNQQTLFSEKISNAAIVDTLCYGLIESLRPITIDKSDRSIYHEIKAELFLDFLKNNLNHISTDNQESQLSSAFESLSGNEENLAILFHVLLHTQEEDSEEITEIQKFALQWILLRLYSDKNCPLSHFIWKQSPNKLRIIAARFEAFFGYYIDSIKSFANALRDNNASPCLKWERRSLVPNELSLSFEEVFSHIQTLVQSDDDVGLSVRKHISEYRISHPEKLVWAELSSKLRLR